MKSTTKTEGPKEPRKKPRLHAIAEREGKSDRYLVTIFLGERPAAHSRSMSKAESNELVAKINDAPERERPLETES